MIGVCEKTWLSFSLDFTFNSRSKTWVEKQYFLPTGVHSLFISRIILTAPFTSENKIFHPVSLWWQADWITNQPHIGAREISGSFCSLKLSVCQCRQFLKKQLATRSSGFISVFLFLQNKFTDLQYRHQKHLDAGAPDVKHKSHSKNTLESYRLTCRLSIIERTRNQISSPITEMLYRLLKKMLK